MQTACMKIFRRGNTQEFPAMFPSKIFVFLFAYKLN